MTQLGLEKEYFKGATGGKMGEKAGICGKVNQEKPTTACYPHIKTHHPQ